MQFKPGMRVRIINHQTDANFKCRRTNSKVYTEDLPPSTVYTIYAVEEDCSDNAWPILLDAPDGYFFIGCSYVSPKHIVLATPPRLTRRHT
jgi:hypothetical protein